MKSKLIKKFGVEKLFAEDLYNLMNEDKEIMAMEFEYRNGENGLGEILIDNEIDVWIEIHGINSTAKRINYHKISSATGKTIGYAVNYSDDIITLMIALSDLRLEYSEFIKKMKTRFEDKE